MTAYQSFSGQLRQKSEQLGGGCFSSSRSDGDVSSGGFPRLFYECSRQVHWKVRVDLESCLKERTVEPLKHLVDPRFPRLDIRNRMCKFIHKGTTPVCLGWIADQDAKKPPGQWSLMEVAIRNFRGTVFSRTETRKERLELPAEILIIISHTKGLVFALGGVLNAKPSSTSDLVGLSEAEECE